MAATEAVMQVYVRAEPRGEARSMETTCVLPPLGASTIVKWAAAIKCDLKSIYRDKRQHQPITYGSLPDSAWNSVSNLVSRHSLLLGPGVTNGEM